MMLLTMHQIVIVAKPFSLFATLSQGSNLQAMLQEFFRRLLKVVDATEENISNLLPDRVLSIIENGECQVQLHSCNYNGFQRRYSS